MALGHLHTALDCFIISKINTNAALTITVGTPQKYGRQISDLSRAIRRLWQVSGGVTPL